MKRSVITSSFQIAAVALALAFTTQAHAQSGSSAISSAGSFGSGSSFAAPVQSFAPQQSFAQPQSFAPSFGSGSSFAPPVQNFAPQQSFAPVQNFVPQQSFAPTSGGFSTGRTFSSFPQRNIGTGLFNTPRPIYGSNSLYNYQGCRGSRWGF